MKKSTLSPAIPAAPAPAIEAPTLDDRATAALKTQIAVLEIEVEVQRKLINTIRTLNVGGQLATVINHILEGAPASVWEDQRYYDTYWNQRRALLAIAEYGNPMPSKTLEQVRAIARDAIDGKKIE